MKNILKRLNTSAIVIDFMCIMNIIPVIVLRDLDSVIRLLVTLYCGIVCTYKDLVGFKNRRIRDLVYYSLIILLILYIIYVCIYIWRKF